jgi:hypothetical protein
MAAALSVAVLLVAGGLMASNMGFKLNYLLEAQDGGVTSASGTNTLALPYNQQTSLTSSADLFGDINATVASSVISISKLIRSTDTLLIYDGTSPATDFGLSAGEGYYVQVGLDVPYIAVGSHAPGLVVQLDAQGDNDSSSGTNFFSFPYHGVAASAADLTNEINGFVPSSVISVSRLLRNTDTLQIYDGTNPATDFSLNPGTAYLIQVASSVPYVPAHY